MNTGTGQDKVSMTGAGYQPELDYNRLKTQYQAIFELMRDGKWRTLSEIALITGHHEASISAQLRNTRKPMNGGHTVNRRRRGDPGAGLHEYQLIV